MSANTGASVYILNTHTHTHTHARTHTHTHIHTHIHTHTHLICGYHMFNYVYNRTDLIKIGFIITDKLYESALSLSLSLKQLEC